MFQNQLVMILKKIFLFYSPYANNMAQSFKIVCEQFHILIIKTYVYSHAYFWKFYKTYNVFLTFVTLFVTLKAK